MRGGVGPQGPSLPSCPSVGVQEGDTSLGTSQSAQQVMHITQSPDTRPGNLQLPASVFN